MKGELLKASWSLGQVGEAIHALALQAGLSPRAVAPPVAAEANKTPAELDVWLEQAASHLGLEAERMTSSYSEIHALISGAGPALVRVYDRRAPERVARFFAVLGRRGKKTAVLQPDRSISLLPPEEIVDLLCAGIEARGKADIDRMLEQANIPPSRRGHITHAVLREWYGAMMLEDVWMLRLPPGAAPRRQFSEARLPRRLFAVIASQLASALLISLAWWIIGQGSFDDQLGRGWLLGWALLLFSSIPFGLYGAWSAGLFAIDAGVWIKRRLLAGALALDSDEIRHEGAGGFLSRVVESEAVESLALGAGISGISALISLLIAAGLLSEGAGGGQHAFLLAAWLALCGAIVARYYRRRKHWTDARLELTNDLVERMSGHRTRLAQEPREQYHEDEDRALARYFADSEALDRSHTLIAAFLVRGWFLIGVFGLAPAFISNSAPSAAFAISVGGILVAGTALQIFVSSMSSLAAALISWRRVAPLFFAAAREAPAPAPITATARESGPLLEAQGLVFQHSLRGPPVLRGAHLSISRGDRILLAGPSGAGKSTLSALLAGLRAPASGLLLLGGFDRRSLGDTAWRRRVVTTPQFHENHVMQSTLAFNLLMGRRWPPSPADLEEAEVICQELGLGELLARMPSGMHQIVGETGWQLSHGEKSRLYIARALLQGAEILLFDESFGALDPETLGKAMSSVLGRAKTVLVIAHP